MNNIYEVPLGMCGEALCPEENMDCWTCTLKCIEENGVEYTCNCGSELCAICNMRIKSEKKLDRQICL